jgi:hypothetical protein
VPLTTHFNDAAAGSTQDVSQSQQNQGGQPYNPATPELEPALRPADTQLVNDVHTAIEADKAFNHENGFGPKL